MTETAISVAAAAGVATFFSPCAYALLPGYVGYYVAASPDDTPLGGAVLRGFAALTGAVSVFVGLGVVAAAIGETLEGIFPALELATGTVLVVLGAAIALGWSFEVGLDLPERRTTVAGFLVFGALYALAAAGCVAPLFLAVTFQSLALSTTATVVVFSTYAGVFGALLVSLTVLAAIGDDVAASTVAPYARIATRLAGVVVAVAGIGQIAIALGW